LNSPGPRLSHTSFGVTLPHEGRLPKACLRVRLDIYLPSQTSLIKGEFSYSFRSPVCVPVVIHLRENYVVEASMVDWCGNSLKPGVSKSSPTQMEKSFFLDSKYGSWGASYLGHDGEVWTAFMASETVGDEWVFRLKELS
jgi:hypothetical protein